MKISKELKIGIAFLAAIFILYYGISFLKGIDIFKPSNSYRVAFDNVEGLAQSTPVTINGFQIGVVHSMSLDKANPEHVVVYLNMDKAMEIPKGSKFVLDVSMLGNASIEVKMNPYTEELYTIEDLIKGERKSGLMEAAEELTPSISKIIIKIDSTLTGLEFLMNSPKLKQSLVNVELISSNLAQSSKQLNLMMNTLNKDLPKIVDNFRTLSDDMTIVTGKVKSMDIEASFKSLDATVKNLEHISKQAAADDNSLGLLLNDRQLYDSINTTINNASLLLKDVKENPSRYINIKVF